MKVFLTGASGFIGSHVARALLSGGDQVCALVRPDNPLTRLQDLTGKLEILHGDLDHVDDLRSRLNSWEPDACMHLAWYAEPGKYQDSPRNVTELGNSLRLVELLLREGCRQFVIAGTCAEYDTDLGYLREEGPTRPKTIYAASKLALKLVAEQLIAQAHGKLAWGRIFFLYGPTEDVRRLVPAISSALLRRERFKATQGSQVRDYLHVEDVAAAFCVLLRSGGSGAFNIASGIPIKMRDLMETIGHIAGHPELIEFGAIPYRDWDPPFICGDNGRLRQLGWAPRFQLTDGLRRAVDWWRERQ